LSFVILSISTMLTASALIPDGAIPFEYHNHLYIRATRSGYHTCVIDI